jgi:hypothetical protein
MMTNLKQEHMDLDLDKNSILDRYQFWGLVLVSILLLSAAPSIWYFHPDSGIYLSSAKTLLETGQYTFNGYPNLIYYPGFSLLLCLPISIFGFNYFVINLFCAVIAVSSLWLIRAYFNRRRYGIVGLILPFIVSSAWIFQEQVFYIMSDGTFLTISMAALLLWRIYNEQAKKWALAVCVLLIAFAPLVRFQGLFLAGAFGLALLYKFIRSKDFKIKRLVLLFAAGIICASPFALWTVRNYTKYTPDTYNMANNFFFGQKGLSLYAPDYMTKESIDAEWKYGVMNTARLIRGLGVTLFGENVIGLIPSVLVVGVLVILIAIGCIKLLKLASNFERIYLFVSCAYFFYDSLSSSNLYIVPRYWLPLLPFAAIAAGFGLQWISGLVSNIQYKVIVTTAISFIVIMIFSYGSTVCVRYVHKSRYWENAHKVINQIKDYMDENTSGDVKIASSDWGVMPFILERQCYKVLTGELYDLSLERINKYQTEYLVTVDKIGWASNFVSKMANKYPEIFSLEYEIKAQERSPGGAIYKIDIERVGQYLESRSRKAE